MIPAEQGICLLSLLEIVAGAGLFLICSSYMKVEVIYLLKSVLTPGKYICRLCKRAESSAKFVCSHLYEL